MSPAAARRSRSTTSQLSPDESHWRGFQSLLHRAMNPGPRVRAIASVRPRSLLNNETCISCDSSAINAPPQKFFVSVWSCSWIPQSKPCGCPQLSANPKPRETYAGNPSHDCPDGPSQHCPCAHAEPIGGTPRGCPAKSRVPRALADRESPVDGDSIIGNVSTWNLSGSRRLPRVGTCIHSGWMARKATK